MPRTETPGERSAFCRRLLRVNRAPRACCHRQTHPFPEDRARCREPAPSVNERSFPARPGTGSTETTQGMGRVAAKMYTVTGSSMTAELLHPTTVIHHFPTHAARTGAVERSDERLNMSAPQPTAAAPFMRGRIERARPQRRARRRLDERGATTDRRDRERASHRGDVRPRPEGVTRHGDARDARACARADAI